MVGPIKYAMPARSQALKPNMHFDYTGWNRLCHRKRGFWLNPGPKAAPSVLCPLYPVKFTPVTAKRISLGCPPPSALRPLPFKLLDFSKKLFLNRLSFGEISLNS